MTMKPLEQTRSAISFGLFSLIVNERLLMKEGVPVELGGRTLDTLIALMSRPNEVVGKRELMAQVWPDVTVEEGSLRFHIAGLRKVLGDGRDGARYITTLAGRGYCFVAPVSPSTANAKGAANEPGSSPAHEGPVIGQEVVASAPTDQKPASCVVTIVGPAGVAKTTVAIPAAYCLLKAFAGATVVLDLRMLNDPEVAASSLASILGISAQTDKPGVVAM